MKKIFIILPLLAIAACSKKDLKLKFKGPDSNISPEQARSNVPHYKKLMGFISNGSSNSEFSIGVREGTYAETIRKETITKPIEKWQCKVSTKYEGTEKKVDHYTFDLEIKKNDSEPEYHTIPVAYKGEKIVVWSDDVSQIGVIDAPVEIKPEYKVLQSVDALIEKGIFQQEVNKKYKAAIEFYDAALNAEEERSKRSELLYRKAMCREWSGDREGQLEIFSQLIQYGVESNQWAKKADETMRIQNEREGGPVRSKIDAKSRWSLKQPLYGQIKFVPDDPITKREKATGWRVVKSLEWFGPMERYVNFSLTNSVMTSGETYTNEGIMIRGEGRLTSGYGKVITLYDHEQPGTSCEITYEIPPSEIEPYKEYLAATVEGKDAISNWKVYIRFTPEYYIISEEDKTDNDLTVNTELGIPSVNSFYEEHVELLMEKGVFLQEYKKDYIAAIKFYDAAFEVEKKRSRYSELLYHKAMCYDKLGEVENKLSVLNQLTQFEDQNDLWVKKAVEIVRLLNKKDVPPGEVNDIRDTLLKATETYDLDLFHSVCDEKMTAVITKDTLSGLSDQLSESLAGGYRVTVVKADAKRIYDVYIWRINCEDGTEFNMTMTVDKKGKVAGCYYK